MQCSDTFLDTIESLGVGFVVLHATGRLRCVNQVVAEILEVSIPDAEGRDARCFMDEYNFAVFSEQQALRRLGREDPYDIRLSSTQRNSTRVHVFPTPLFDAGEFVGSCGFVLPPSPHAVVKPVAAVPRHVQATALALVCSSSSRPLRETAGAFLRGSSPFGLSTHESEVLERLTPGNSVEELALELGISVARVRSSLLNIYAKYGVRNRIELLGQLHVLSAGARAPAIDGES